MIFLFIIDFWGEAVCWSRLSQTGAKWFCVFFPTHCICFFTQQLMYRFFFCFVLNVSKEFFFLVFFASLNLFCLSDILTIFPCSLCVLLLGNLNMFLFLFSNFYQNTDTGIGSKFCQNDKSCAKTSRCKLSFFLCYCETSQHKYKRGGTDVTTSWGIFSLLIPCSHLRSLFILFHHLHCFSILFFPNNFIKIYFLES